MKENKKLYKPKLASFIKHQYYYNPKRGEKENNESIEYAENRITKYISVAIFIFLFTITFASIKEFLDNFVKTKVVVWLIILIYALLLFTGLEIVHWFYAKYEKVKS